MVDDSVDKSSFYLASFAILAGPFLQLPVLHPTTSGAEDAVFLLCTFVQHDLFIKFMWHPSHPQMTLGGLQQGKNNIKH